MRLSAIMLVARRTAFVHHDANSFRLAFLPVNF